MTCQPLKTDSSTPALGPLAEVVIRQPSKKLLALMGSTEADREKFWQRVNKTPTCWFWDGPTFGAGYGCFTIKSITIGAHRFAYWVTKGTIEQNLFVCHHCDNPICVNPSHLFLGTHLDNMRDCRAKGRSAWAKNRFCIHGHEFTPENTRVIPRGRICLTCYRINVVRHNALRKQRKEARRNLSVPPAP